MSDLEKIRRIEIRGSGDLGWAFCIILAVETDQVADMSWGRNSLPVVDLNYIISLHRESISILIPPEE
jgi:hypothetical protein